MPHIEIKTYQAQVYSGERVNRARAAILLLDGKGNTIGSLTFVDDGAKLPSNVVTGPPQAYYAMRFYQPALDLLRNESPVYLDHDGKTEIWVTTMSEAVGDGDKLALATKVFTFPTS